MCSFPKKKEVSGVEKEDLGNLFLLVALLTWVLVPVSAKKVKLTVWGRDLPDDDPAHAYIKALVEGFKGEEPRVLNWNMWPLVIGTHGPKPRLLWPAIQDCPTSSRAGGGSVMGGICRCRTAAGLDKG